MEEKLSTILAEQQAKSEERHEKVISAEKFRLVDENGKECGSLETSGGSSWLTIGNQTDNGEVLIYCFEDASGMSLSDETGAERIELSSMHSGPVINIYGKRFTKRPDRTKKKDLFSRWVSERSGLSLSIEENKSPSLVLSDSGGKKRISLFLADKGAPALKFTDETGSLRAALGTTTLVVTKTGEEHKRAPSSLIFFDKDGKVMWKAP